MRNDSMLVLGVSLLVALVWFFRIRQWLHRRLGPLQSNTVFAGITAVIIYFVFASMGEFVVDCWRFVEFSRPGQYEFATAAENKNYLVLIPPTSSQIIVHKTKGGYCCRFCIDEYELQYWAASWHNARNPSGDLSENLMISEEVEEFDYYFGKYGWKLSSYRGEMYYGPDPGRWQYMNVWYDRDTSLGYIAVWYF